MEEQQDVLQSLALVFSQRNPHGPLREAIYNNKPKRETLTAVFGARRMRDTRCPLVVVCASPYGDLRTITSWGDPDVLIADALDASSAAPVYFDPVFIKGEPLIDGGVVSNSPVDVAVACLGELFGVEGSACGLDFEILSIGNRLDQRYTQKLKPGAPMGLMQWMQFGMLDMLIGANRAHAEKMVNTVYSGSVTRIVGDVPPRFDDVSREFREVMDREAERVFAIHGAHICAFFASDGAVPA
jgi:predicted acylesterase/phospholipase RssA